MSQMFLIYLCFSQLFTIFHLFYIVGIRLDDKNLTLTLSKLDILFLIIFPTTILYFLLLLLFIFICDFIKSLKLWNWLTKPMKFNLNKDKKESE